MGTKKYETRASYRAKHRAARKAPSRAFVDPVEAYRRGIEAGWPGIVRRVIKGMPALPCTAEEIAGFADKYNAHTEEYVQCLFALSAICYECQATMELATPRAFLTRRGRAGYRDKMRELARMAEFLYVETVRPARISASLEHLQWETLLYSRILGHTTNARYHKNMRVTLYVAQYFLRTVRVLWKIAHQGVDDRTPRLLAELNDTSRLLRCIMHVNEAYAPVVARARGPATVGEGLLHETTGTPSPPPGGAAGAV